LTFVGVDSDKTSIYIWLYLISNIFQIITSAYVLMSCSVFVCVSTPKVIIDDNIEQGLIFQISCQ